MIPDRLAAHAGDVVAVGLFAAPGGHAAEDVPEALAADPRGGERRVFYTGAIGADPAMAGVIATAIAATLGGDAGTTHGEAGASGPPVPARRAAPPTGVEHGAG